MTVDTQKLRELLAKATPGPWRWEFNQEHRSVHLVGGKPQYDLTVMGFTRWGMSGAGLRLRELSQGGMDLMHKLHDRPDWIEPFPGRAHHKHWCAAVSHPDMQLMTDAVSALPALLDEIDRLREQLTQTASMLQSACLVISDPEARVMALQQVRDAHATLNPPAPPQGEKDDH